MHPTASLLALLRNLAHDPLVWIVAGFALFGVAFIVGQAVTLNRHRMSAIAIRANAKSGTDVEQLAPNTVFAQFVAEHPDIEGPAPDRERVLDDIDQTLGGTDGIVRFVVGGLTILGLLLTFVGMLDTLTVAGDLIKVLQGQTGSDVNVAFTKLVTSLQDVLTGMIAAFGRTIVALVLSLMLGAVYQLVLKVRAGVTRDVATCFDEVVLPWYRTPARTESIPAQLVSLHEALTGGFQKLHGASTDHARDLQDGLNKLENAGHADADRLETALVKRRQEEQELLSSMASASSSLTATTSALEKAIDKHADYSNDLVQAMLSVVPQGKQVHHFEDLKTLLTGVNMALKGQVTAQREQADRLEKLLQTHGDLLAATKEVQESSLRDAQQLSTKQNDLLATAVERLSAPPAYATALDGVISAVGRNQQTTERWLREVCDRLDNGSGAGPDTNSGTAGSASVEMLLATQNRLMSQMLHTMSRPWWVRWRDAVSMLTSGRFEGVRHRPFSDATSASYVVPPAVGVGTKDQPK